MRSMEYVRPTTLEDALEALQDGVAMSGGTYLTPMRETLERVVDLQDLGLDGISQRGPLMHAGATVSLEEFRRAVSASMPDLARACRVEAALNLRNGATLAGTIVAGDGRSALLCGLMALKPTIETAPGQKEISIEGLFEMMKSRVRYLMVGISFEPPRAYTYHQVARSPFDLPILSVAAARFANKSYGIAVGGWGDRPRALADVAHALEEGDLEKALEIGSKAFQDAGDDWASSEYRASVGPALLRRALKGVMA